MKYEKKVAVIGLGSMGKRRIRNLKALGFEKIYGFDLREDRKLSSKQQYGIQVISSIEDLISEKFDALIISTPPDTHHIYMKIAIDYRIPAFIEASVLDTDFNDIIRLSEKYKVLLAPSCTLLFHPGIILISQIIKSSQLGQITNVLYHSGQYLPDWHSFEDVSEFYVSNKETGGAREIIPFELTWLTKIFGFPKKVAGFYIKTLNIKGAEKIDDTYNFIYNYETYLLNISVDVVSRHATRRLLINGALGQIYWDWDENMIKKYDSKTNSWTELLYDTIPAQSGYNKNITEQMYIDELNQFFITAFNDGIFPNNLIDDQRVLNLLYAAERSAHEDKFIVIK